MTTIRNEMACRLMTLVSDEQAKKILDQLDIVLSNYKIENISSDVVPYYGDNMPVELKYYIADMHVRCMAIKTIKNYTWILKDFFSVEKRPLKEIEGNDIKAYLFYYQQSRSISNRSLDKVRQILNSFFTWCVNEEYLVKNPMKSIKKIKYAIKQREAMTQLELEQVRQACKTIREKAIVELLYSTGCRISELSALKISDISWETKEVSLFGKGGKYRTSYLNAKAEVAVKNYLKERKDNNPYLIVSLYKNKRISKDALERLIKIIVKRSGLTKNITPHIFRHTTATTALENGMEITAIQKLLGHSNVATTMIYAEVNQSNVKAEFTKAVI